MDLSWFDATDYELAREILQRGVAAVFVIAFLSTAAQFPALLGERGLLPAPELLARAERLRGPTLFRRRYSDRLLRIVSWTGIAIAASLVVGLPQEGPPWLPLLAFTALWFLYLSVVNIGQEFYGFGWEMLLVEAGLTVGLLGSHQNAPPLPALLLVVWLVFRLEFGAGMIKMRGDRVWRDLTALYYHHETQPMPNPVSRLAHLLPKPIHRLEVIGNHIAQLVVPFLLFVPGWVGAVAALVVMLTQGWLVVSGNFAWLNALTIVLAAAPITDSFVHALVPAAPLDWGTAASTPDWFVAIVLVATAVFAVLSRHALQNLFSRRQLMNASFNPLNVGNAYGAFGSITRERYEVVIEGTLDADPRAAEWREYHFRGKPGDVRRRPRHFAPYHLRLDWMMWFLALGSPGERWFVPLLVKLLEADAATLRLLRADPFDGARPRWVRARLYLYRFTTHREKRATGDVWVREEAGMFARAMSLRG